MIGDEKTNTFCPLSFSSSNPRWRVKGFKCKRSLCDPNIILPQPGKKSQSLILITINVVSFCDADFDPICRSIETLVGQDPIQMQKLNGRRRDQAFSAPWLKRPLYQFLGWTFGHDLSIFDPLESLAHELHCAMIVCVVCEDCTGGRNTMQHLPRGEGVMRTYSTTRATQNRLIITQLCYQQPADHFLWL